MRSPWALTADAAAGATTLTVASAAALAPLAAGDLVMVVQMQGATIDATNTATYGAVTALNGAGLYELVTVASVVGNVVTLNAGCGLKNAYSAAAHTQVVWVPQYQKLTVSGAGSITAPAWNGTTGGVVAVEAVTSSLTSAGAINVAGLGFRGGVVKQQTTMPPTAAPPYASIAITAAAEKGEGVAGFHTEYDANGGRYGIGAPANGGGGGGAHNSGGGGGANGNNAAKWTGAGVMLGTVTGAGAWTLDPDDIANGGLTTSAGGGRGGYDYSANVQNALTIAPGNALWGGDDRQSHGGRGGRPLVNAALSQVFLGGGGGAGESNNGAGTSGAAGGGLVFVVATSIDGAGTGSIIADGATAATTLTTGGFTGNDAPGGGGGGGTVVLVAPNVTNVTVSAAGGGGGLQSIATTEAEGPGGGGGGGFIAVPAGFAGATIAGGAGGTTNSSGVVTFPRNGATDGATGQMAALAAGAQAPQCIATDLGVTMTDAAGNDTPGTNVTYTIVVTNNGPNPATGATVNDAFSGQYSSETWTCTGAACPAATGTGSLSAVLLALGPGAQASFTVTATVASGATGTLSNTVTVAAPAGLVDSNPANNTATDSNTLKGAADLSATLSNTPATVVVGAAYSYTVGVSNAGPSDAATVSAQISIPAGATFVSASGAGWTCAFTAPNVTCTRSTLAAGTSAPITVNLTAPSTVGSGSASLTVSAATGDPNSGNNTATDTITFACGVDTDCASGSWCSAGACTVKTANGQPVPAASPINGQCTAAAGARVCQSGACDPSGNVCGINLGDGTCATTAQCNVDVCVTTGPNAGKCERCAVASDCSAPTPACDVTTNLCVQCSATNAAACTGTTPVCSSSDTCVACNGDNGTTASNACPTATPYCSSTGACVVCTTDSMCAAGTHAGPNCDVASGACTTACTTDAECGAGKWCDESTTTCTPTLSNGSAMPTDAAHSSPVLDGSCSAPAATLVCQSGVCDPNDNECGYASGDGSCTAASASTVCRSGTCSASGVCMPAGGCLVNADCTQPASPVCDTATSTCVAAGDAGASDAGAKDGGARDASAKDGGGKDAAVKDAGLSDGASTDGAGADSGPGLGGYTVAGGGGCAVTPSNRQGPGDGAWAWLLGLAALGSRGRSRRKR